MSMNFLKTGKDAKEALATEKAKAAARKAGNRFYLTPDSDGIITFLDGKITDDGIFDTPMYYEHDVRRSDGRKGSDQYVCVASGDHGDQACPLCQDGHNLAFVGVMTIIDHSVWKDKEGKEVKNRRRLFVYKRDNQGMLLAIAKEHGGALTGCTFKVIRPEGQRTAKIGTIYTYKGRNSLEKIRKAFGDQAEVLDYKKSVPFVEPAELRKMGFGAKDIVGSEGSPTAVVTDESSGGEPEFNLEGLE